MRATDLKRFLKFAFKNNYPILIKGSPGIGKTDIVEWSVNKLGYDLLIMHPVVDSPIDYKGLGTIIDGEAMFKPYGNLKLLITAKKPLVVFFDDLGQAPAAVQSAVMQLLLARQINGQPISKFVRFVAATNRREDKANVSGILEPVKSRFASIVELEVNVDDWIVWAEKNGMPSTLIHFIQFKPNMLNDFKPTRDIENSPCPRTVANVGRMIKDNLRNDLLFEAVKGATGIAFANEFTAFLRVYKDLPTVKEILADPVNCKLPEEVSARFAIMGMVLDAITIGNMKQFLIYLDRLGTEITTATMKLCSVKKPDVCKNMDYVNWAITHNKHFQFKR
jgi:hypothetical protein